CGKGGGGEQAMAEPRKSGEWSSTPLRPAVRALRTPRRQSDRLTVYVKLPPCASLIGRRGHQGKGLRRHRLGAWRTGPRRSSNNPNKAVRPRKMTAPPKPQRRWRGSLNRPHRTGTNIPPISKPV